MGHDEVSQLEALEKGLKKNVDRGNVRRVRALREMIYNTAKTMVDSEKYKEGQDSRSDPRRFLEDYHEFSPEWQKYLGLAVGNIWKSGKDPDVRDVI